ncbi:hypothetical protein H6G17_00140 [Chroococcidiopsis sp. FACHB-1243]|uniref:hypothetical protein n=1 Tax=Chroococcidiopsis sp. [FACHB-1243] TaxID=2692781 RepID=UPI00177B2D93|nr:hypothetical protein [Chroococcidiopsis sp. [FACHB-1243]]MBD2303930.1 hypothetical protein [Chroococcidiopsis sp. [FACHB-1243]]
MKNSPIKEQVNLPNYRTRTPEYYLQQIEPNILASFNTEQLQVIINILTQAIPQASPKIVDFRFNIDLIFSRFYLVLFVGKDRRKRKRQYIPERLARIGNAIAVVMLLLGANLVISGVILLFAYLFKSAVGIDFFPGHISDSVKEL